MSTNIPFLFDRPDQRTKDVSRGLIAAIVARVQHEFSPSRIILFGSQARGIKKNSDIDLFVQIPPQHVLAPLRRSERATAVLDLFRYRSFGLDVLVYTDAEVEYLRQVNEGEWDLVLEILNQGKVIYERPEIISA